MVARSTASATTDSAVRLTTSLDPQLSTSTTLQVAGVVIAIGTALGLVWRAVVRPVYRLVRRLAAFARDWSGEPARPGHARVPGVMERLQAVEAQLHGKGPAVEQRPGSGGGSGRSDSEGPYG